MGMYTFLFGLIKAAAKEARGNTELRDYHYVMVYDHFRTMILSGYDARYLTTYQRKLLEEYLDRVWGTDEETDNGY